MELGQRLPPHSPKATGKKKNKKMWASWKIHYESWIGYDRLVYRLSNDELTMVRLLQLEVKAGFKPGCKQVSSRRHKRRSHEKGRRQNLDRRTGSDHSQRHYPLPFVSQSVTGVDLIRSVPGVVDVPWNEHVGNPSSEPRWKLRIYINQLSWHRKFGIVGTFRVLTLRSVWRRARA